MKNKLLLKAVGEHIRFLRQQRGISQGSLANEAEIPLSQIGRIERGLINPTLSTLYVIAEALKTDLKNLVDVKITKP